MLPIPRIEYFDSGLEPVHLGSNEMGHPGLLVTDNKDVRPHSKVSFGGVQNSLSLGEGRSTGGKIHHISGKALGGQLKTTAGPGRWLKKKISDHLPLEGRYFFGLSF